MIESIVIIWAVSVLVCTLFAIGVGVKPLPAFLGSLIWPYSLTIILSFAVYDWIRHELYNRRNK